MAATGIEDCEVNLTEKLKDTNITDRLIEMAVKMTDAAQKLPLGSITLKIGIHIGEVIAGVIGYHKP